MTTVAYIVDSPHGPLSVDADAVNYHYAVVITTELGSEVDSMWTARDDAERRSEAAGKRYSVSSADVAMKQRKRC